MISDREQLIHALESTAMQLKCVVCLLPNEHEDVRRTSRDLADASMALGLAMRKAGDEVKA